MHIPDGFIPAPVCLAGYGLTGLITWSALKQIQRRPDPMAEIPKAALLAATFFVISSIHIPVPPASLHLVLNGLLGAVLGSYAFPAILIGLFFQALFLGHGGLTTLGVDALIMGIPAIAACGLFRAQGQLPAAWPRRWRLGCCGFLAGAVGVGLAVALFVGVILLTIPPELDAATERRALGLLIVAYLPVMLAEGVFTALLVLFLRRVKPELLEGV